MTTLAPRPAAATAPPPSGADRTARRARRPRHDIARAMEQAPIGLAIVNSVVVAGCITVGTVLCCTLAGFAFAKLRFRGNGVLLALVVGTMMVPTQLAIIPPPAAASHVAAHARRAGGGRLRHIARRVAEAARILDLEPYLQRRPKALCGGQRQRVAMGRAIVRSPQVFLMDEPLSDLDAMLRVQTRTQSAALQQRLGVTTVYGTHDQVEAMTMGDRVAVPRDGAPQQCDSPGGLYDRPANVFVAGFIGSPAMNVLTGPVADGGVRLGGAVLPVPRDRLTRAAGGSGEVTAGFRPETLEVCAPGDGVPAVVAVVEQLGSDAYLYATLGEGAGDGRHGADGLRVREDQLHVLDPVTGLRVDRS